MSNELLKSAIEDVVRNEEPAGEGIAIFDAGLCWISPSPAKPDN